MKCIKTALPDVWIVQPDVIRDRRGFFLETYHRAKFAEIGITEEFVQDNQSRSARGTLRGLHYQLRNPQAKICRVAEGEALDVAVDIRVGSPNFGRWVGVVLSAERQNQIYIPKGFAHGFLAVSESVQFIYKCSEFYKPDDEYGVLWNDPDLDIAWGELEPLLSEKDRNLPPLAKIPRSLLPAYIPEG
jgi:dTDP-4-dehydrorhamnose 3,5-epimerase